MTRTETFLTVWFVVLAAYSVYALCCLPADQTVSATVFRWARANPILAFLLGLLVGHWCWPARGQ